MGINRSTIVIGILIFVGAVLAWTPGRTDKNASRQSVKIAFGKKLFFDVRLSYNQTKSCASCHDPAFAFTDGYRTSAGADGFVLKRNAPSLLNAVYRESLTWGDSSIKGFEQQLQFPFFNTNPKELGQPAHALPFINRLKEDSAYQRFFAEAFGKNKIISLQNVFEAIAAYEASLVSFGSAYDNYLAGDKKALSEDQIAGMQLFFSSKLKCSSCHVPEKKQRTKPRYENIGLYNINGNGDYPFEDQGLYALTKQQIDKGKFRVPPLRNVLLTAPYTHNGSVETIEEMIDIYARGGRAIEKGTEVGDGRENKFKSPLVKGFSITATEKKQLIAFLDALTDTTYLNNK